MFLCQKSERPAHVNYSMWDSVDEFTYDRWDAAIDKDGKPLYTGTRAKIEGDTITISGTLSKNDLGILARMQNIKLDGNATGYVLDPVLVKFKGNRGNVYWHEVNGGEFVSKKVA